MPLEIDFKRFDTVCYSIQHNLMELIKSVVGITVQVNINTDNVGQLQDDMEQAKEDIEAAKEEADKAQNKLNSLTLEVNATARELAELQRDYNLFTSAVTMDLDELRDRIVALEGG